MANVDNPRGLWPVGHLTGGEIKTLEFTTSGIVFKGDMVKAVNDGTVAVTTATDALILGVAATYAASGAVCQVYVDPMIIYGIQAKTGLTPATTSVFGTCDTVTYLAGNATTGVSKLEADADPTTGDAQLMCIGKIDSPDNAWGEHVDLKVIIHEHHFHMAAAGVGKRLGI